MGSIMLNRPTQNLNNAQSKLNSVITRAQQMGPDNMINEILSKNPQLAQKFNTLMQMNSGRNPTEIAIQLMQDHGLNPSMLMQPRR